MSSATDSTAPQNRILAALPPDEYQRLVPHLEEVQMVRGEVLYEIDEVIKHVYFPINSMVSLVTQMNDGKIIEVGMVGKEGMTGISALMGNQNSFERAVVQLPNGALRSSLAVIQDVFDRGQTLQKALLRYATDLMRQVAQTAACNASHTAEERLSRWLLMCQDRVDSAKLRLTQEFLAEMLGTRRGTVNVAAITLQSINLIKYQRGSITIVDRRGLEEFSCECYQMVTRRDGNRR